MTKSKNNKHLQSAFESYNLILEVSSDPLGPFTTISEFKEFYDILLDTLDNKEGDQ